MWSLIFLGLAIYYLIQITTWTLPSFRQGIVVRKYQEPFSGKIPKELTNQEIICNNIIFKFNSPGEGLFRAYPKVAFMKSKRKNYFPSLLGEVNLSRKDVAEITLRVPLSLILLWLAILSVLVISNVESILTINSVAVVAKGVIAILIFGVFAFISFDFEKTDLRESIRILNERANNNVF